MHISYHRKTGQVNLTMSFAYDKYAVYLLDLNVLYMILCNYDESYCIECTKCRE